MTESRKTQTPDSQSDTTAPEAGPAAPQRWMLVGMLAVALVAGILIGPWGIKQAAPARYNAIFVGGVEAQAALEAFDAEADADRQRLVDSDVTAVAIAEWDEQMQAKRAPLQRDLQKARRDRAVLLQYIIFGLLAISFATGIFEATLSSRKPAVQAPLRWASYGSFAVALLILGAAPALLGLTSQVLMIAAVVLGMTAGAIRRAAKMEEQEKNAA